MLRNSISVSFYLGECNSDAVLTLCLVSVPKVTSVVYFTRSIHPQESEHVIRKVVDELNESSDDSPFRLVPVDSAVRESVLTNDSFYQPLVNMKNVPPDICKYIYHV